MRGVFQVALAASLWGTWSLFLRPTGLPGIATASLTLAVIGLSALVWVRAERQPVRWDRNTVGLLLLYGVLDAVNMGTFFAAMSTTTLAVAVLTHCSAPVLVALLAPRLEGTRVRGSVVAALVAVAGLTLLLRPWEQHGDGLVWGATLGLCSAVAYAAVVFTLQPLVRRVGVGRATSYHAILASLLLLPFAWPHLASVESAHVPYLVLAGLVPGTLATLLFVTGLRAIGSARAAVLTLLEPLVAVGIGWLVWQETLAPAGALGALMVLGAALWVSRSPPQPLRAPPPKGEPVSPGPLMG